MATGMPTLLFFLVVWRLSKAIAGLGNKNRQQSNAGFLCWSRIYDCVMECLSLLNFRIFSLKHFLFWNIIKNVKPNKIYGPSSFNGVKEIVRKALQFSWIQWIHHTSSLLATQQLTKNHNYLVHPEWQIKKHQQMNSNNNNTKLQSVST